MSKHTEAAGAAQAKTGKNRDALDRHAGLAKTATACEAKTRSRYKGTDKHNHYEGCSCSYGSDNIKT